MQKLKSISRKTKIALGTTVFLVLSATAVVQILKNRFPIELHELEIKWDLHRHNVQTRNWNGWTVYERDLQENAPSTPARTLTQNRYCLLFIHGLGDQALTWRKLLSTSPTAWNKPALLFAVDLPGSGLTSAPKLPQNYRARILASDLAQRLQNAPECSDWLVVGNSFGGMVAAWIALDHPEKIRRLALVGAGGLSPPPSADAQNSLSAFLKPTEESILEFQKRAYFKPRPLPAAALKAAVARMAKGNSQAILAAQTPQDWIGPELNKKRNYKIPTWVIWGEADRIVPMEVGQEWHRKIRGSFFRTLPQCGHLPQKECPEDLIRYLNESLAD